jgi:diguanylate cyclase (GGDEF)-like protein
VKPVASAQRRVDLYFGILGATGTALCVAYLFTIRDPRLWGKVALFAALFAVMNQLVVRLPGGARISVGYPLIFASLVSLGIGPTMIALLPGALARVFIHKDRPLRAFYAFGQYCVCTFIAGNAYVLTGGRFGYTPLPQGILSMLAAALCWDLFNIGFAQGRVTLQYGGNWLERWLFGLVKERGAVLIIYHTLSFSGALLYQDRGAFGLAVACAALFGMYNFFRLQAEVHETKRTSVTDRLTQVFNYRYLADWLQQEFPRATRGGEPLAILWVDVDGLKRINDSHGHEAGNVALKVVADILKASVRQTDTVVRYGGDEFVVVLPHTGGADAQTVADRIQEAVGRQGFMFEGRSFPVELSIGIARFPQDAETPQELLTASDRAMYQQKQTKGIARLA